MFKYIPGGRGERCGIIIGQPDVVAVTWQPGFAITRFLPPCCAFKVNMSFDRMWETEWWAYSRCRNCQKDWIFPPLAGVSLSVKSSEITVVKTRIQYGLPNLDQRHTIMCLWNYWMVCFGNYSMVETELELLSINAVLDDFYLWWDALDDASIKSFTMEEVEVIAGIFASVGALERPWVNDA